VKAQQAHQLSEAIQAYRRATEKDPSYFDAQYNLGLAAYQANNLPLSLTAYEKSLAILPESEEACYNFALALKQANFPVDAAHELEKVLAVYPNDGRAHLALGNIYAQELREPAKARVHYRRLLEIDPRNPQAPSVQYWLAANPK
jgi:superkiller protein 3